MKKGDLLSSIINKIPFSSLNSTFMYKNRYLTKKKKKKMTPRKIKYEKEQNNLIGIGENINMEAILVIIGLVLGNLVWRFIKNVFFSNAIVSFKTYYTTAFIAHFATAVIFCNFFG